MCLPTRNQLSELLESSHQNHKNINKATVLNEIIYLKLIPPLSTD